MPLSPLGASLPAPRTRLLTALLATAIAVTGFVAATPAHASTGTTATVDRYAAGASSTQTQSQTQTQQQTSAQRFQTKADRVLQVTRYHKGDPYRYGAAGPHAFDCSGLVMFVFRRALGRSLPHYAESQWQDSKHITRAQARPGDLVFQLNGNYAFHVGIYAGNGYMWDAPHSGARVHRHLMYSGHWGYGRLIRS